MGHEEHNGGSKAEVVTVATELSPALLGRASSRLSLFGDFVRPLLIFLDLIVWAWCSALLCFRFVRGGSPFLRLLGV